MGLRVELKPGERFIVGRSIITNGDKRSQFFLEGREPVLREKDIMRISEATTPARRIYMAVQLIYLEGDSEEQNRLYLSLCQDFVAAAPSASSLITTMSGYLLQGLPYKALHEARQLIGYEDSLLSQPNRRER